MLFADYIMTNIQNIRLTKIVSYVPASIISSGYKIFGFPKESYNSSNWGLVIEVQN